MKVIFAEVSCLMVLLDDKIYKETVDLVLGRKKPSPIVMELSEWFFAKYSVTMLNFEFSRLDNYQEDRYRLYIILKDSKDYTKMHKDIFCPRSDYQKQIFIEFSSLARKHNFVEASLLTNFLVVFNDFSHEAKTDANWSVINNARRYIKNKYNDVWYVEAEFERTVVFYYCENDISKNKENGLNQRIKLDYYTILKKKDRLNYYSFEDFVMSFDSKENIDKNYEGSLFYYSRR